MPGSDRRPSADARDQGQNPPAVGEHGLLPWGRGQTRETGAAPHQALSRTAGPHPCIPPRVAPERREQTGSHRQELNSGNSYLLQLYTVVSYILKPTPDHTKEHVFGGRGWGADRKALTPGSHTGVEAHLAPVEAEQASGQRCGVLSRAGGRPSTAGPGLHRRTRAAWSALGRGPWVALGQQFWKQRGALGHW